MGQNTLPPGVQTFLSSEMGAQLQSAMRSLYENIMLDTADGKQLTDLAIDLGVPRPPAIFSNDDLWRASVKVLAYGHKHTRSAVASFMELLLGPITSQVTTLSRTTYTQISKGDTLTINPPSASAGNYTVSEVLTHHLIFPAATFTVPELNVSYKIDGTTSGYGNLVELSDGRQALVDVTVSFVNTHPYDFITKINADIPQYGKLTFNKNAIAPYKEESFTYQFYDGKRSGILKLETSGGKAPTVTHNQFVRIRSSVLNASVKTGALSIEIKDSTNFPTSPAMVPTIQAGDNITILTVPPVTPAGAGNITAVSKHELTIGGGGLPVPGAPLEAEFKYIVTAPGSTELSGGRGHFLSKKGKILSATRLVDYTVDFLKLLKPYVSGSKEPFSIVINRGHNNEETIEVLSRAGTTINLALNPNDALNETSLLKFDHDKGETVEVFTKEDHSTGAYFALNGTGTTVAAVSAGSTPGSIVDTVNTPFVAENANASYGDELEIVTTVTGGPAVGERRTITTIGGGGTTANVSPDFTGLTTIGCTYRVRKLYKPGTDRFLYLADSSMFPAANFSVILDRGTTQEEVVWIDQNTLATNRLRIANSDSGTTFVTKKHNFGMSVEPAQVLIKSCNWDIIETRATGEFTLAIEGGCIPSLEIKDAWYLHEKTPAHLVNASSDVGAGGQIGQVRGDDVVGGVPTNFTYLPDAPLQAAVAAGQSFFMLTNSNFVRLLGNAVGDKTIKSPNLIFRPIFIDDGNAKEEKLVTTINRHYYGTVLQNVAPGATTFISSIDLAGMTVVLGQWNGKYAGKAPFVETRTVGGGDSVLIAAGNPFAGNYTITVAALDYEHVAGESIVPDPVRLDTSFPFKNSYAVPANALVNYIYAHPSYRAESDIIKFQTMETLTDANYPASTAYVRKRGTGELSRFVVNDEIYIKGGAGAPLGERRSIAAVGGIGNKVIFVGEDDTFSATVTDGDEFDIRPFLQSGDISDNIEKDISANANSAQSAALNSVNLESYAGGHKSIFPGCYIYRLLNDDGTEADQPSYDTKNLLSSFAAEDASAAYKLPGPRRLIAPPTIPYGVSVAPAVGIGILKSAALPIGVDLSEKYIEILGPTDSLDYRRVIKINGVVGSDAGVGIVPLLHPLYEEDIVHEFRVLGAQNATALVPGDSYCWIDYPELFPDPAQGDFIITVDRGGNQMEDLQITTCVNALGPNYGRCTINAVEKVEGAFNPGTSVELKVTKLVTSSTSGSSAGGLYLAFGYGFDSYKVQDVGLGADSTLAGSDVQQVNDVNIVPAGVHPPVSYESPSTVTTKLKGGMYVVPNAGLKLPTPTLANTRVRCQIIQATGIAPAVSSQIKISDFNFLKQKYKSFIGGTVSTFGTIGTQTITDIDPVNSTLTVVPAYTASTLPPNGAPIVILAKKVPFDNKERQSEIDYFFTLGKFGSTTGTTHNGIFPTVEAVGGSTTTLVRLTNSKPLSTALVGNSLLSITPGSPILGQRRQIVKITETAPGISGFDQVVVFPAFSAGVPAGDELAIIPAKDFKFSNLSDLAGGVYTGINAPNPINTNGTTYPALTTSSLSTGVNREYGIVQEYVEYSSRSGRILTLSEPFYSKYDHLPGSTVVFGTGQFATQGYGRDYRPFLTSSYLDLLFKSGILDLNSLFCAAGIESKTEVTELGS